MFAISQLLFLNNSFFLLIFLANSILINSYNEGVFLIKRGLINVYITKPETIIIISYNTAFFETPRS